MAHSNRTHRNPPDDTLREIYGAARVIAVVGASGNRKKPAHQIPLYLQRQGYRIVPVNPGGEEILGQPAVDDLSAVTEPIDVVDVFRPAQEAVGIANEAVAVGAKVLWLQTGIVSEDAAAIAEDAGLTVVMDACMGQTHQRLGLGPGPH